MEENIAALFETICKEGGKKAICMIAKNILTQKQLENIFVRAGHAVGSYEKEKTEENELREIAFCEDNMKQLATEMQTTNEFWWEAILEKCLDELLNANAMSVVNKDRCKQHFMKIVQGDMERSFSQIMERSYVRETRDNSVAILGCMEQQKRDMEDFLHEMRSLLPERQGEQQNRERQEKSDRAGYAPYGEKMSDSLAQTEWNLKSLHIKGVFATPDEQRQEIISLTQIWREEREQYPGWYILPYAIRERLRWNTRETGLFQQKELVPIEIRLEFCYEYVWRCERGMLLYDMWTQKNVRSIWEEYNQVICRKMAEKPVAKKDAPEGAVAESVGTVELQNHWFYIGQVLLREYREDGAADEWQKVYKILRKYEYSDSNRAEEIRMEAIKYAFSVMDISKVAREIRQWNIPKEQYVLRLQAIGLLAECGETVEAVHRLAELKREITQKLQEEEEERYALFLKSLSASMLQLESLLLQGYAFRERQYEQRQEDINRILEQIEEGRAYFDWQSILDAVKDELLKHYVKGYEVKNPFELNRETVSIMRNAGSDTESYYLYRVLDALALPLAINHVTLMSNLELPWIGALLRVNTHLALFMLVRGSKTDSCKTLINRKFLAGIQKDEVVAEVHFLIGALDKNLRELSDEESFRYGHIYNAIQQNAPELLQRFMSRCPVYLHKEALVLLKRMMESEGLELGHQMDAFVAGMMAQVSERTKAEMLGTLISTKICEHSSMIENRIPLDIFDCYFRKNDYDTIRCFCRVEKEQIEELLACGDASPYVWRTKVARLEILYDLGLLNQEQQKRFAKLLWSRINESTKMPDLPNRYIWTYMQLPHEESNAPAISIKAFFLQSGLMKTLGNESGCKITLGEIRYLDELNAMVQGLEKDFWCVEEVEQIFEDAVAYWQVLRKKLENTSRDIVEWEFRTRARKIARTLAEVYNSISEKVSTPVKEHVCEMLREMQAIGISNLQLMLLLCEEEDGLLTKIQNDIFSTEDTTAVDAICAAYTYITKYPEEHRAKQLLGELQQVLRARKKPGVISAIYMLHNLLYSGCTVMTDEIVSEIDCYLMELEKATRYEEHMDSDHEIKEMISIRKACTALAFQMYRRMGGACGEGVLLWKRVAEGDEFTDVKNEWYADI